MNDFPDIINAQIISNEYDVFWSKPEDVLQLSPRSVLVASLPFSQGSAEAIQLKKILEACKLKEDDYNILQFNNDTQIAWHLLRDQLKIKSIILLGINPQQLGISAQLMPHQLSRFNNCNWVVTESLDILQQRPEIKTHLWNYGLKPAFVDKVYG